MKIRELITELQKLNPEADVVTDNDEFGGFNEVTDITHGYLSRNDNIIPPSRFKKQKGAREVVVLQ